MIPELPRSLKRFIAMSVDAGICALTVLLSFYLRVGELPLFELPFWFSVIYSIVIAIPIFTLAGLYRAIFRFSGWYTLITISKATLAYGVIYSSIYTFYGVSGVPRTIGLIQPVLLLLFVGASRALARFWLGDQYRKFFNEEVRSSVLIYGAGSAGRQLAAVLRNSADIKVIGFLDDDRVLHGHLIDGKQIYNPKELARLTKKLAIRHILLALPKIKQNRRNEILRQLQEIAISVRTLPNFSDLASGKIGIADLQDLDIDDLLGRESVSPDFSNLSVNNVNKVVLVTGAGGSIGGELCRQLISVAPPKKLILIEQSEFALYSIHEELQSKLNKSESKKDTVLVPLLASIQDSQKMQKIISTWAPNFIYHAAAYKHVPLVEHNVAEGVKNNVFGTLNLARIAGLCGVEGFILISTDKAVRPTNMMGATKRLAEMILQALSKNASGTRFSMVRFGNVLDSSGSVVPKFRQQIKDGGPVSLTHPDITRYFMTIPEAAQLVLQAGSMAQGGEVFLLDMGQPIKIIDLARRMIELSGFTVRDEKNPDGEISIEITGLRPGEKLYEELLIGNNSEPTSHPKVLKASEDFLEWAELEIKIKALELMLEKNDVMCIRAILEEVVTGYHPESSIVDFIYSKKIPLSS